MTALLIAEELFLLTHDDESGKASSGSLAPDNATAGALLLDLAEHGLLKVDDKKATVNDQVADHPLLADTQAVLAGDAKVRSVSHWVSYLPSKLKKVEERVGDSLVARGILGREEAKVMKMFTTVRWPERNPAPERELRAGLVDVLVRGLSPTPHQELLIPLLAGLDMIPKLVEKDDRKTARATAKAMTDAAKEGKLVSSAITQTVQATQAAVMVAVLVPVVVTSVT